MTPLTTYVDQGLNVMYIRRDGVPCVELKFSNCIASSKIINMPQKFVEGSFSSVLL